MLKLWFILIFILRCYQQEAIFNRLLINQQELCFKLYFYVYFIPKINLDILEIILLYFKIHHFRYFYFFSLDFL